MKDTSKKNTVIENLKILKTKIIKKLFYVKKYKKSTVYVCSKERKYINSGKYVLGNTFYFRHGLPNCPHCGFHHTNSPSYHYDIIHGSVLRPNFLGKIFLLDSILMSGVIYK